MKKYDSSSIEVLSGLDPVRKRPGMYTSTDRPNHLAQEVIDNSIDEVIEGHAKKIDVRLFKDGSLEVKDDGRGMPIDDHPDLGIPGVEVILTKLHSGGKFSKKNYKFSGGLHGVGVSVVNALSKKLEVWVKRDSKEFHMSFADGQKKSKLKVIGKVGKLSKGTRLRFWPDEKYFDNKKFNIKIIQHSLRAKAVLSPGLRIRFFQEGKTGYDEWFYEGGLAEYLKNAIGDVEYLPKQTFANSMTKKDSSVEWAIVWQAESESNISESYVNLIPTPQGGTHVSGLRTGLTEAIREFCEFHSLLPRGLKISPEDVWGHVSFVLSIKVIDPQFSGQTKERLTSKESSILVSGTIKDSFGLWLNENIDDGKLIAELAINAAQQRHRAGKKVIRKRISQGPALPGKLADCLSDDQSNTELFLVEGDSAGGSAKQARDKNFQAIMPLRGKIMNTWEVDSSEVLSSQEVHDISVAIGVEPGSSDLSRLRFGKICILADADSDGLHIATLLCALFVQHFNKLVENGHIFVAMPPLYRIDFGKKIFYALDENEKQIILKDIKSQKSNSKVGVQRFKGLGEMNPSQLRETTMNPDSRRLVQLSMKSSDKTKTFMDMLLAKKRSGDRKNWLQKKGDLAEF
tara:strand:+ start:10024 stop:11907 length:1884 start_codon:yes stop_codon:yes gene_type:complete